MEEKLQAKCRYETERVLFSSSTEGYAKYMCSNEGMGMRGYFEYSMPELT